MSEIITDGGMSGRDAAGLSTAKTSESGLYKSIYDEGAKAKEAKAKSDAARQSRFNALQSGRAQGKVSGTVDVKHLTQEQQKQVGVIRAVARETGINMVLFESKADANGTFIGENGHFDSATNTIWIDVNAGKNSVGDTNSYALLRVLSHELTHFIQAGSAENYAALKAFAVSELEKQGKNLDDLVQDKLTRAANMRAQLKENKASEAEIKAHELSRADAEDEVIADACEMMLRDSAAIGRLAETDAGLYGKVKAFVLGFIKRVKDAFDRIDANSQEAKALMQGGKYLDELQRLWDVGLEQAVRNGQRAQSSAGNAEAVETKVQFQARVGYTEEGLPVYSSNFLNGSTREERQTRILHLVTDVWSKKPIRLSIEENGKQRTILANFDPYVDPKGRINSDATKLAYGNRKGTMSDQKTTEKLADDFPEIISTAQFAKSKIEEGKTTDAHKDVLVWHYFVNKIGFINDNGRYAEYGVNIDVKERKDGEYFYSFAAQKIKGSELSQAPTLYGDPKAIHASVRKNEIVPAIANIIIPDSGENSNKSSEKNIQAEASESSDIHTAFSLRDKEPPKKTVIGYKAFYARDGKLYPPMVSNITEEEGKAKVSKATSGTMKSIETPVGVWLDADVGGIMVDENGEPVRTTDTKRLRVKNDKSGGGATLAFRPGWHLGEWPDAKQFNKNDANGNRTLMPDDLVFAKCEVSADVDYQLDALAYGINAKGKLIRSQAGLPRVPVDGMYKYRTNVDPTTAPWIIAGSMRVLEVLSDEDCARICAEHNVEPSQRYSGHPINLADFGLKQGAVSPTGDLARFAKNDASRANDALLERALSDKQYADAYVARDINFDDPALANEFAMNGQNIEEYRKQYEEKVQRSDRDYAEAVETKVQYSDRPSDQMEEDKYFERMMDKWDGQATGGRVRIGSIKSGSIYTGVGLPAGKLFMDYSKIAKALDNHSDHLDIGIIKQIPTLLSTPVVITEPINPQVKNTVNVFGELRGENGIPIMVALLMRADQGGAVMVNIVRTIEMRSDYARLITDASTLYLDKNKKRTHEWFQGLGNSSVPFAGTRSGVIRSIAYQAEIGNNSSEKNIRRSDRDYAEAVKSGDMKKAQERPHALNGLDGVRFSERESTTENHAPIFAAIENHLSAWTDGSTKSVKEVRDMLGGALTPTMEKWIHNQYEKGQRKNVAAPISKKDILAFIAEDKSLIAENEEEAKTFWAKALSSKVPVHEVELRENDHAGRGEAERNIASEILNSDGVAVIRNTDTKEDVTINRRSIGKTLSYGANHHIPYTVTQAILLDTKKLLADAKYIGSHEDYTGNGRSVHYFVCAIKIGNDACRVVFMAHETTNDTGKSENKLYVEEVEVIDIKNTGVDDTSRPQQTAHSQHLTSNHPSTVSIADLLQNYNTEFLRSYQLWDAENDIKPQYSDRDISDLTPRDVLANLDLNSIENGNVALAAKEFQRHAADLRKVTQRIAILRGQIADAKAKNSPTMSLETQLKKQLHLADLVQARMDKAYEAPSLKAEAEARLQTIQKYVKGKTADEVARDIRGMQAELSTLRAKARKADSAFNVRTLASLAQSMRDDFGATMPTQTISDRLLAAFSAWQNAKTEDEENAAIGAVGRVLGDVLNSCTFADDSAVTGTADIRAALKGARTSLTSRQMQEAASQSLGSRTGIRIGNMQKEDACAPSFLCLSHRRYIQAKDSSVSKDSWVRI